MKIDPADLAIIRPADFKLGGYCYYQTDGGEFRLCLFRQEEIDGKHGWIIKKWILEKTQAGRIFVNAQRPWWTLSLWPPVWERQEYIFTNEKHEAVFIRRDNAGEKGKGTQGGRKKASKPS